MELTTIMIITAVLILSVIVIIVVAICEAQSQKTEDEFLAEEAGRYGELRATEIIQKCLDDDDRLFTNITVFYDGKETELDNVIVNKYGVFIIEVKNYNGSLVGREEDFEWTKYHTTEAGNTYAKIVKNPIKQVKRQVYILARHLEENGAKVWVKGYTLLLNNNSPVKNEYVLKSTKDIYHALHTADRTYLSVALIKKIIKIIKN